MARTLSPGRRIAQPSPGMIGRDGDHARDRRDRVRGLARRARPGRTRRRGAGDRPRELLAGGARRARRRGASTAQLGDRAALRRALRGVDRVFHVAGTTNLRASPEELSRVNVEGTRTVLEEALRAGVERVVHTSSIGAVGPARPHGAVDERHPVPAGLGVPYAESKHAAETEALRVAAHGLAVVIVCPAHVLRRRRPRADVDRRRARLPAPAHPRLRPRRDQRRRRRRRRRRSPARRRARRAGRALPPRQPQLHLGPAVRRARAALGHRGAGARAAASASRSRWPRRARAARSGSPSAAAEVRGGGLLVDVQEQQGAARARLDDAAARGHGRGDGALVGGAARRAAAPARRAVAAAGWRLAAAAARAAGSVGGRLVP